MANFSGIALDKDVQESNGAFTVLPAGKYKVAMVGDELKDNKSGTGKILAVKLQVIEGVHASTEIEDNINLTNPSPKCQAIGQGTLKRICVLCGVPYPPQDTNGLMGKPMVVTVSVEEFTSNTTGKTLQSNSVKKYEPGNTVVTEQTVQAGQLTRATQQTQNGQMTQPQQASGW